MADDSEHSEKLLLANRFQAKGLLVTGLMLLGLLLLTWLLEAFEIDLNVARWAYSHSEGWPLGQEQPWFWIHRYGTIPGFLLTLSAIPAWYFCQRSERFFPWRHYVVIYGLVSILGAGIVVNALLKEHSGRPRPRDVVEFGGNWEFRKALDFGTPGKGRSFPCGHCTMGFSFSVGIVFWQRSRLLATGLLITGLAYGSLVSIARVLQGAHFVTDALWAMGVLWLTLSVLYYFVFKPPLSETKTFTPMPSIQQRRLFSGILLAMLIMTGLYITRRPFYQAYYREFKLPLHSESLLIQTNLNEERFELEPVGDGLGRLHLEGHGFALPDASFRVDFRFPEAQENPVLHLEVIRSGYFAELETQVKLKLPAELISRTQIIGLESKTLE